MKRDDIAPFVKHFKVVTFEKVSLINVNSTFDESITNYIAAVVLFVVDFV